ncbi:MAG: FliA/WhiG family RNA polymerase sigma factor [Planctomycetota bacterium]
MAQTRSDGTREKLPGKSTLVGKTRMQEDPELERVWIEFKDTGSSDIKTELKNDLLERYLPIVRYTADRLHMKLPQQVDVEDLYGAGVFGLMDAIENYDLTRGVKFETYCTTRVRGSIIDSLRSQDWVPRLVRSTATRIDAAWHALERESGRAPTDLEMAQHLGVTDEEFQMMQREASAASLMSLSDQTPDDGQSRSLRRIDLLHDQKSEAPEKAILRKSVYDFIMSQLDDREQKIIDGYYNHDMTMKQIGIELELSESRVCQLHSRIMTRMRQHNSKYKNEFLQD